jgi:hypothetical protein
MYTRFTLTCPCFSMGERCGHPLPDPKGREVFAKTSTGQDVTVSRCQLWPGHGAKGLQHRATMLPSWGTQVVLTEIAPPAGQTFIDFQGTCARCGEVYEMTLEPQGRMVVPEYTPPVPTPEIITVDESGGGAYSVGA